AVRFLAVAAPRALLAPDGAGATALHRAAARGHVNVLELLQELGVDPLAPAANGKTAVHFAAQAGQREVLAFFPPSCSLKLVHLTESILRGEKLVKPVFAEEAPHRTWLDLSAES
ncbi:unnamed protein product, partial [Effrenium voratum]